MQKNKIPVAKINYSKEEEMAVLKVLQSGQLSQSENVEKFERAFAEFTGVKYALALSSGTAAIYLSLLALDLPKGCEVITTPFTYHSTITPLIDLGLKPVFADIGNDFNIDAEKIKGKITKKTKAILPVHLFGNPCSMNTILNIAKDYKLQIVEDASQSLGAKFNGKKAGSFGNLGCFSFYATKNITTGGEGGMITTSNENLYQKVKALRANHLNFRMTELQATLGIVQLKKLPKFNKKRAENARFLTSLLEDTPGMLLPKIESSSESVFHQYTIRVLKSFPLSRNDLSKELEEKGVGSAIYYSQPVYKKLNLGKYFMPQAEKLSNEVLSLPIHPLVTQADLKYIAQCIKEFGNKN